MNYLPAPGETFRVVDNDADLAAFDQLPPPLRETIRNLPAPVSAEWVLSAWEGGEVAGHLNCMARMAWFQRRITEVGR